MWRRRTLFGGIRAGEIKYIAIKNSDRRGGLRRTNILMGVLLVLGYLSVFAAAVWLLVEVFLLLLTLGLTAEERFAGMVLPVTILGIASAVMALSQIISFLANARTLSVEKRDLLEENVPENQKYLTVLDSVQKTIKGTFVLFMTIVGFAAISVAGYFFAPELAIYAILVGAVVCVVMFLVNNIRKFRLNWSIRDEIKEIYEERREIRRNLK